MAPLAGQLPGHQILQPGKGERLQGSAQTQTRIDGDVTHVVDGQRNVVADDVAHRAHVLDEEGEPHFGELDPGVRVHRVPVVARAVRGDERTGDVPQQVHAEVHLEEGEARGTAGHEMLGELLRVRAGGGVRVTAHPVTEPAAEQHVGRNLQQAAGQVVQGHVDRGHAATLTAVEAELAHAFEDRADVQRVLAEQPALEHQRVVPAGAVTHLAVAAHPDIRVQPQDRGPERHTDQRGYADVGDTDIPGYGRRVTAAVPPTSPRTSASPLPAHGSAAGAAR